MVAEDPKLAEAGERYLARQMGPPKNFRGLIPLPGQKMKSMVVAVVSKLVDQPIVEESLVLSTLKLITPTEVLVEDVTYEEAPEAANLPPEHSKPVAPEGGDIPVVDLRDYLETPEKVLVGPSAAEITVVVPAFAEEKIPNVPSLFSEGDGAQLRHQFKRPRATLGSTSTSILEGLVHADPCSDVPLKRVSTEVRDIMARYA